MRNGLLICLYLEIFSLKKKQIYDSILLHYLIHGVKDYAIFALDPGGVVVTWNMGAERAKGYSAEEIIGKHFSTFYTQEARDRKHPDFELVEAKKNGSYEEEGWRVRKDGSQFWAHVTITAIYDDDGNHIGFAKVTRDLTEKKQAIADNFEQERFIKQQEEAFRHIVNSVKDYAIFMLSPAGYVKTWNAGAQKIKGYTADEIIGKHFSIFYKEEAKAIKHPEFELKEAVKNGSYEEEGWRLRKDGTPFWASVTITAVIENGQLMGFVKVTRDLTEKRLFELQLAEARDEAVFANQMKTKFVANITHEIRTPLGGIIGLSELIADNDALPADARDSGNKIFQASRNLLRLLNDLLDYAKLEAGKVELDETFYSVEDVVKDVIGLLEPRATEKSLMVTSSISEDVPKEIFGDCTKVRQILLNLVQNSIKFTQEGGVEIAVEKNVDEVVFSVTDTGIGISDTIQARLFKPFTQGHDPSYGGTGLGLSICQQFVELMGGRIEMVSEQGQGTSVSFSLPLKRHGEAHAK